VTEKELKKLKQVLQKVKLADDDSIRLYRLCEICTKKITIWGKGVVTKDKDYYIS